VIRLLFVGDIVGKPGRELVRRGLGAIVARHRIDLVIANGENAAAGFGLTPDLADDLFAYGVHVITGGNHTWDKKEIIPYFAEQSRLLRPANFPAGTPGRGRVVVRATNGVPVGVVNTMGRVFMVSIEGDGLHHRCRYDWPARLGHRRRSACHPSAFSDGPAAAVRSGQREPAPERGHHRG
jgi:calcineurin-like phosphoesterase